MAAGQPQMTSQYSFKEQTKKRRAFLVPTEKRSMRQRQAKQVLFFFCSLFRNTLGVGQHEIKVPQKTASTSRGTEAKQCLAVWTGNKHVNKVQCNPALWHIRG